jgi:hypothetical protein
MRVSMSLIVSASRSNSSPRPETRTHRERAQRAQQHRHPGRPQQRVGQQPGHQGVHLHVAPDQQMEAARQLEMLHLRHPAVAGALDGQLVGALLLQHPHRQAFEVAGELVQRRIGQQVERVVVDVADQPLLDGVLQRQQPAIGVALAQPLGVGVDRGLGLAVQQAGGGPPEEHRERQRAEREHARIDHAEAHPGGEHQLAPPAPGHGLRDRRRGHGAAPQRSGAEICHGCSARSM